MNFSRLTFYRGRCPFAAVFALALLLQTTCNAFCLTSFPSPAPIQTVLLAPNCHHGSHNAASNSKSDDCHHPRLSDAPAIQTKPRPSTVAHASLPIPAAVPHLPPVLSYSEPVAEKAGSTPVPKPLQPLRI
jgi:hypothetical protein